MPIITAQPVSLRRPAARSNSRDQQLAILLLLPAALTVFVVMIVPLGFALYASLSDYALGQENRMRFVFLDNYLRFFSDPVAIRSLINTIAFTILSLAVCLCLGLGIAVLLKGIKPSIANVLRAVFAMPLMISPIIVSLVWRYIYDPTYGLAYYLLGLLGLNNFGGLTSSTTALLCIVVADVWHTTPFIILVASAGLSIIPDELYEAARMDGASPFHMLFKITIPLMAKVLTVLILIRGTDAFRIFDLVYGLTGGGPANATTSLSIFAYTQAFENSQMGFAMAASTITLVCLVVLFGPLMRNPARPRKDQ
jgi:ABC-type sugar transport system permease subunit